MSRDSHGSGQLHSMEPGPGRQMSQEDMSRKLHQKSWLLFFILYSMRMEVCFCLLRTDAYATVDSSHRWLWTINATSCQCRSTAWTSVWATPPCILCFRQYICNSCIDYLWTTGYPKNFLGEKLQNHGFWCPGPLYPVFILVDLIFLEGDCQQVLFKWMIDMKYASIPVVRIWKSDGLTRASCMICLDSEARHLKQRPFSGLVNKNTGAQVRGIPQ